MPSIGRPFHDFLPPATGARVFAEVDPHPGLVDAARRGHDHGAEDAVEARYLSEGGLILQCSHCRRVRGSGPHAWDWVPRWVARSHPNTSHVICPSCVGLHWGRRSDGRVRRKK